MRFQRPKEAEVSTGGGNIEEADSKAVAEIVEVDDGVEAEDDNSTNFRKDSGKRNTAVL